MASKTTADYTLNRALRSGSWLFAIAFVLSFLFNVLRLTGPLFMLLIYDRVLSSRSEETLVALFALVVAFLLFMGLFDYARKRLLARFGAQFQERIETQIFNTASRDKFFAAGLSKPASGLNELDNLRGFFHSNGIIAIFDFIWAPMFLIAVFSFSAKLGWVACGGLALLTLLTLVRSISSKTKNEKSVAARQEISDLKDIMKNNSDVVRGQQMAGPFKTRWLQARQYSRDKAIELNDLTSWFSVFSRQIRMLTQYSVLAVGAYLAVKGQLSIGAMVASMFLVVRVLLPVEQFLNQLPAIRRAITNWASLSKILKAHGQFKPEELANGLKSTMSLSAVWARSSVTQAQVLKGINIDVTPGQVIEITGQSGSGKSLLAEVLLGIWPRSAGNITCDSVNIDRLSSNHLADFFGYVPEIPEFVPGTIKENIARLDPKLNQEKVIRAAKRSGIHKQIMALPDGYDTMIGATDFHLSKGQKHRIALARALYGEPNILVLDEPDGIIRSALKGKMASTFDDMIKNKCSIIVLARNSLGFENCDNEYQLEDGRLKPRKLGKNVTSLEAKKAQQNVTKLRQG